MDYFRHDINASEDDKILDLLERGGYEQLGYYWRFVEYLYSRGGKVDKCRLSGVAWSLHMDSDILSTVICAYGLFDEDEKYIYSKRVVETLEEYEAVGKHMAEIGRSGGQASAKARAKRALEKEQANGQAEVNRALNRMSSVCLSGCQADAQQNKEKKNKEKKNKEEYNKEIIGERAKRFSPPHYEEVKQYSFEKGREDLAQAFFDYYSAGEWKDRDGKQVKSWKQKFIVWMNKNPKKEDALKQRQGNFDHDVAFQRALERTYEKT